MSSYLGQIQNCEIWCNINKQVISKSIIPTTPMIEKNNKQQPEPYFEKQGTFSLQCGMHCINNLFKQQVYSIRQMENICYELSNDFINPHKHVLGGDYDANVVIMALQKKGYQCEWLDGRKQIKVSNYLDPAISKKKTTLGFLVNVLMPKKLYHRILRFSSRHWYSVRLTGNTNQFELCDSLQEQIKNIKSPESLSQHFNKLKEAQGVVIWVYKDVKQT